MLLPFVFNEFHMKILDISKTLVIYSIQSRVLHTIPKLLFYFRIKSLHKLKV